MLRRYRSGVVSTFSFAAVLLVVELAARTISPTLPINPEKWPRVEIAQKLDQMRRYVNDDKPFGVAFIGSSMMAGGIDPVAFTERSGLRSYNAAFAGPSMRTITPWTLDIVEPLLEPEVVVLGIQSRELSDNGPKNKRMFQKFDASPGYRQATENIALRFAGTLERVSHFLRLRRAFREPTELFAAEGREALEVARVRQQLGPLGKRVQHDVNYRETERFKRSLYNNMLYDFEVGGPETAALERLYDELNERDVKLVVVNMPVTDAYWEAHQSPSDRSTYRKALERFLRDRDVTFIDAEDALAPEAFRNPMHLDIHAREWIAGALAESWDKVSAKGSSRLELTCDVARAHCRLR